MHLNALVEKIRYNCDLSDARFAGHYSICGLALRLRDLFKWEQRLAPWEERDATEVLGWIDRKEQLWNRIQSEDFVPIEIDGTAYDPFDTDGINARLGPHGLFYGAGYAQSLKPSFVLGRVDARRRTNGLAILHLGEELARDLLTLPALSQGADVVLRKEAARLFVWDQIFYITPSRRPFLDYALRHAGVEATDTAALRSRFSGLLDDLYDVFVNHEIGERNDTSFDTDTWRRMIAAFPHSPVELLLRAVKDMLADTGASGPLHAIIKARQAVPLGFYLVFHDGLGRQLYPEMRPAFEDFARSGRWSVMNDAVHRLHRKAGRDAARMMALFAQGQARDNLQWTAQEIRREFLDPLERETQKVSN